jgi:hypothetical protein
MGDHTARMYRARMAFYEYPVIHSSGAGLLVTPLEGRPKRFKKAGNSGPDLAPARKSGASSLQILTSKRRWDESPFRIPE